MRHIGIVHRVKKTRAGEARPTMVCIAEGNRTLEIPLETETDELDFLLNRFPVKFRLVEPFDNLADFPRHHIKWQKVAADVDHISPSHLRKEGKQYFVAHKVPEEYQGLQPGDVVAMQLGGSGDRFGYAIANRGQQIGAKLLRLPPAVFMNIRNERIGRSKGSDHCLLASLAQEQPNLFQEITPREKSLIRLRESYFNRTEAMKEYIACSQRLAKCTIGRIFLTDEGGYPEGSIEDIMDSAKANDAILQALNVERSRRESELKKLIHSHEIWQKVFEPITGCGEMIAARLICAIGDPRRFTFTPSIEEQEMYTSTQLKRKSQARLKAYCGVHVLPDGRFPRRRHGEVANWSEEARQALFLLGDQFNRRPDSEWGKVLLHYRQYFTAKHPEIMCKDCGKDNEGQYYTKWCDCPHQKTHHRAYNPGHILRMATWRTLSKFVEKLYIDWCAIYNTMNDIAQDDAA